MLQIAENKTNQTDHLYFSGIQIAAYLTKKFVIVLYDNPDNENRID